MLEKLLDFADPNMNLLFQPAGRAKRTQIHRMATQFAEMYTPDCQGPEPTLMRKFAESIVADPKYKDNAQRLAQRMAATTLSPEVQQATSLMARMSGHSGATRGKYYDLNSKDPVIHALSSQAYI